MVNILAAVVCSEECLNIILAVQNERGPRQPFPDRHMHITGSFPLKPEVKEPFAFRFDRDIEYPHLAIVCPSGHSDSFDWQSISIHTFI